VRSLLDILRENPGNRRVGLLSRINEVLNDVFSSDHKACVLAVITNVFAPVPPLIPMLILHSMEIIEQALIKFRADGCENLYLILTTLGGDINFPELFVLKVRGLGFKRLNTIIPSIAMSAGTLLAVLSDRIIGFSSASIGPIDPQIVVQTPQGPRVISAIAFKRLIEEALPKLAEEKKLGVEGLSRLYIAQDLYLYQEALRSLDYVKRILNEYVRPGLEGSGSGKYESFLNDFLMNVESHGRPLSLSKLKDYGFNVVLLDADERFKELVNLIIEYHSYVGFAFLFEPPTSPGSVKTLLIGTPFTEMIQEATLTMPAPPVPSPPAKPERAEPEKK